MENFNEQTLNQNSQSAAAEDNLGEMEQKVSFGKFKDANALLDAYNSLQSEFTKRCQKVKELEEKVSISERLNDKERGEKGITQDEKEKIVKDYLYNLLSAKSTAIVLDGEKTALSSPVARPKSVAEAGLLAKELLKN